MLRETYASVPPLASLKTHLSSVKRSGQLRSRSSRGRRLLQWVNLARAVCAGVFVLRKTSRPRWTFNSCAGMSSPVTAMRPRISIAALLAGMVPIAVGLAALTNPTEFWEGMVFALTMLTLFTALVGVFYRKGADRSFWVGFALFGWGFFVLGSDLSVEFRSSSQLRSRNLWEVDDEHDKPVTALVKILVDYVQLNRRSVPISIGDKVQVKWGNPSSDWPAEVLEIKANQYKIRYNNDPQGSFDEWVGPARIKRNNGDRCYRIAELLFTLLCGLAGAVIGLWFYLTRKVVEPATESKQSVPA